MAELNGNGIGFRLTGMRESPVAVATPPRPRAARAGPDLAALVAELHEAMIDSLDPEKLRVGCPEAAR